jgi:hypothetical protein
MTPDMCHTWCLFETLKVVCDKVWQPWQDSNQHTCKRLVTLLGAFRSNVFQILRRRCVGVVCWYQTGLCMCGCVLSGGGLLYLRGWVVGIKRLLATGLASFLVCNPITRSWRIIPEPPLGIRLGIIYNVKVLAFDKACKGFKIFLAHCGGVIFQNPLGNGRVVVAGIYDSVGNSWTTVSGNTFYDQIAGGFYCNGCICFHTD